MQTQAKVLYARLKRRRKLSVAFLAILIVPLFLLDVSTGPSQIPLSTLIETILKGYQAGDVNSIIVWDVRVPVALTALLVGSALGLAGVVMQTVLDNPLASPYTLGVSAGAAFGASLVYALNLNLFKGLGIFAVSANAFIFALLTSALVYALGSLKGLSSEALVLAGIAVNYLFHALLSFVEYLASEESLQAIVFWIFGSLYKTTWEKIVIIASAVFLSLSILLPNAFRLTALRLGDEVAETLGVSAKVIRAMAFIVSSLLTSVSVCFYGIISFVGLAAPHIARVLVGEDQRYLMISSSLVGALLLSASSIASKSVSPGAIIPIGIITSFVGVPFFVAILLSKKRRYW